MPNVVINNDAPTLDDVNRNLLKKLNEWIETTDELSELVELSNVVAKLNASSRNNDLISMPVSEEEQVEQDITNAFGKLAEAVADK